MRKLLAGCAIAAMAGCAHAPASIPPTYVSVVPYESWSCEQLRAEQARLNAALAQASVEQQSTHDADLFGVFLLGVPLGSLSHGDLAAPIGQYKGQLAAVAGVAVAHNCSP